MDLVNLENRDLEFLDYHSNLRDYIYERSRVLFVRGDSERDAIQSVECMRFRQKKIREHLIKSLGGLPPRDTPLNARTVGTVECDGFTIEKVIFESRPHHYVTANLYLPRQRPAKCGAVLFACGHHVASKHLEEYQFVCQTLALAGLIVLAQDPIGQGERSSFYDVAMGKPTIPLCSADHMHQGIQCELVGDSIARYFLHDSMRSIDYLNSRSEVDPECIGMTGNSGGGTQTSLMMMGDPRIAAAAPATFIMNRDLFQRTGKAQDEEQIWPGFTAAGYDHEDILLAMAPKPVCVLAVTSDFFPIEATRRTVARCKRMWRLFGQQDSLELVEDNSTHAYTPLMAQAAARFFARHLLHREIDAARLIPSMLPEEDLWCTNSGQVLADFPDARTVFDDNLDRAKEAKSERAGARSPYHEEGSLAWLRDRVFAHRQSCDLNFRFQPWDTIEDLQVETALWWTQPNLANTGTVIRHFNLHDKSLPATIALWDGGTKNLRENTRWIRKQCSEGRAVLVLNICGMGPMRPHPANNYDIFSIFGIFHKLCDDLIWLDDSLPALRTYEVLRALEVIESWPRLNPDDVRLFAKGRYGVYARLATALEPRIQNCEWVDGFDYEDIVSQKHFDSFDVKSLVLPGALRHFDLSEL